MAQNNIQTEIIQEWWEEPGQGDKSMEDDHLHFWDTVLDTVINIDLSGKTILDFGCNRGGFLRLVADRYAIEKGVGIDIAAQSIEAARQNAGDRPLQYEARTSLDGFDNEFDVAFSTAVIYLLPDMVDHAKQIHKALKPKGTYFITHPDYTRSKGGQVLTDEINKFASVKCAPNTLDDIVSAFENNGFKVSVKRMTPQTYFPITTKSSWFETVYDKIEHEYAERYAFCMEKLA